MVLLHEEESNGKLKKKNNEVQGPTLIGTPQIAYLTGEFVKLWLHDASFGI